MNRVAQSVSAMKPAVSTVLPCACFILVAKALIGLMAFDLFGFSRNFSRLHQQVEKWPVRSGRHVQVARVCEAINSACVWYPKRVLCLQRSAVLTCLLRSGGIPSKMVLGVQSLPFKAHAWTEVDGAAVNERRDVQKIYQVWDRF
jgi:hypothetical protein